MLKFSVFIPTYNAERWIASCLESIFMQDYPHEKIEVIVADGGSRDGTREIATRHPVRFFENPKQLAHYAFRIYGNEASGDLTVMFAADNELSGKDWFLTVNDCFEKNQALAAVWGRIVSGDGDAAINKYIALIQNEPLSYFINKNIPFYVRNGETDVFHKRETKLFRVTPDRPLVWGANGLVIRFKFAKRYFLIQDFIGDNDIFQKMVEGGHNLVAYTPSLNIVHHHVDSIGEWAGKLRRNYKRHFLMHRKSRNMNWAFGSDFSRRIFFWFFYAGIPIFSGTHAIFLAVKNKNRYWLYHPVLNFLQFFIYSWLTLFTKEGRGLIKDAVLRKV